MCSTEDASFYFLSLVFFLTVFLTNAGDDYPPYEQGVTKYDNGQSQLTQIEHYSEHPRYGQCWTSALARLHEGCKQLTEDEQGRMALSFANCHLKKAGFYTYQCTDDQNLTDCLQQLKGDISAFNAYTEFFTHTQDICFFLQSQVWHERTENTVSRLAKSSEDVAEQLDTSSKLQEEMIEKQSNSLEQQAEILKNEAYLKEALKASAKDLEGVFTEIKQSTKDQQAQLDATFDRVTQVQRVILGEFTWFNSFLFYAVAVLISYLLTSTPRTSSARLLMFAVLAVDWVVERMIFSATDSSDQELLYHRMWVCRQLFCFIAVMVLVICAYRYKDFSQINYKLLLDIKRQNSELRHKLDDPSLPASIMSVLQASSQPMMAIGSPASAPAIGHPHQYRITQGATETDSGYENEPTGLGAYSSDEGATSGSDPDHTYQPELTYDHDETDSLDSFTTANPSSRMASRQPSRVTTPIPPDDTTLDGTSTPTDTISGRTGLFNSSILNASAFLAPLTGGSSGGGSSGESSASGSKRKRGRPKGSKNRSSRESTPMNRGFTSPYNLRHRRGIYSPNPVLQTEDVRTFIQQVESFQQREFMVHRVEPMRTPSTSSRSQREAQPSTSSNAPGFFSSDDEM